MPIGEKHQRIKQGMGIKKSEIHHGHGHKHHPFANQRHQMIHKEDHSDRLLNNSNSLEVHNEPMIGGYKAPFRQRRVLQIEKPVSKTNSEVKKFVN